MEDPLPPMPQGGYYVVEVTGGFVNNSIVDNTLDLTGKSSTGIVLERRGLWDADRRQPLHRRNDLRAPSTPGPRSRSGRAIGSAASRERSVSAARGLDRAADLGAVIEDNTIHDSLGGILIGVQHAVNYWAGAGRHSLGDRPRLRDGVGHRQHVRVRFELSSARGRPRMPPIGNNPAETSTPPTVTIGSGWSAEAPGPYGSPRFPWTVGGADHRQRQRSPDLRRPDRERRDGPGQFRRGHRGRWRPSRPRAGADRARSTPASSTA